MRNAIAAALLVTALGGCATTPPPKAPPIRINEDPYPSTYARYPGAVRSEEHTSELQSQ